MMANKPSEYWRKRFEMLETSQLKKGQAFYTELEGQYRKAIANTEKEISTWYQRFADNNRITLTEAKRMLNTKELTELRWDVDEYIKYGRENALDPQWMKQLENASAKVHVSRLEALKLQMQQQTEVIYGNQLDGVDKLARGIYSDGYYHTAYEIQRGLNVGYDLQALNENQISKVISKPWAMDGKTFSDRIWTNKAQLTNSLHTQLTQTIIRGDAPQRAIKNIADEFGVDKRKAGRLIMTESAFFASQSQKDCFNDLDVEKYEIVSTLDSHTSELCQGLDGHVFDMKDYEVGVTAPPFHPYCRTVTVPYFEDDTGERAARGADGKTYYVSSDMKYKDWKAKVIQDDPNNLAYFEKHKYYATDKIQFEKYKEILGNKVPETLDNFQQLKYNDSDKWNAKKREYSTILKINSKETYSNEYRDKLINTYYDLKKDGYEFTDHALNRFLGQKIGKSKMPFSKDDLLKVLRSETNYLEGTNRAVKFYDNISVVQNKNTTEVVTVIARKTPKKGWDHVDK